MTSEAISPAVRVGHVHLRVADLDRAIAFYRDGLGLGLVANGRPAGLDAAFLAAHTGLHHVAFLYPDRRELGRAVQRLIDRGYPIDHATDHGASVSVYLSDPDGNGIELYFDRPRAAWFDDAGRIVLKAERFDHRDLLGTPETITAGV